MQSLKECWKTVVFDAGSIVFLNAEHLDNSRLEVSLSVLQDLPEEMVSCYSSPSLNRADNKPPNS